MPMETILCIEVLFGMSVFEAKALPLWRDCPEGIKFILPCLLAALAFEVTSRRKAPVRGRYIGSLLECKCQASMHRRANMYDPWQCMEV